MKTPTQPRKAGTPRNKFEKAAYEQLKKAKTLFLYEDLVLPYALYKNYLSDFVIFHEPNGPHKGNIKFVLETKGYFDGPAQMKMKAVKRDHPDLDIRIVFQDAGKKIRKGAKLTYGEWATKWGFPWAEGKIPKKWLK